MKILCIGIFGLLACTANLGADGYSELDEHLIAEKDYPFPNTEADLAENSYICEKGVFPEAQENEKTGKSEKGVFPNDHEDKDHQNCQKSEKGVFPQSKENDSGQAQKRYPPEANKNCPPSSHSNQETQKPGK